MAAILLDNSMLGNIFAGGEEAGVQTLQYLKSQYTLYMTDIDYEEATSDLSFAKDEVINGLVADGSINTVSSAGSGIVYGTADAGELAQKYVIDNNIDGLGDAVVATDDLAFYGEGGDGASIPSIQTQDIANAAVASGALGYDNYLNTASANTGLNSGSEVTAFYTPAEAFNATPFAQTTGATASDTTGLVLIPNGDSTNTTIALSDLNIASLTSDPTLPQVESQLGGPTSGTWAALPAAASIIQSAAETLAASGGTVDAALVTLGSGFGVLGAGLVDVAAATNVLNAYEEGQAGDTTGAMATLEGFWGSSLTGLANFLETFPYSKSFGDSAVSALSSSSVVNKNGVGPLTTDAQFNDTKDFVDPIVLDLSSAGTGVQLTSIDDSSAYFDVNGTGFAVHTGWVGPDTGILVKTPNPTSINDLFGNSTTDGLTALSALDTNHDGVINSSDSGYYGLYVWQDANGNGVADSGEVQSLSSRGISSISLDGTSEYDLENGNIITSIASFDYSAGGSGEVAETYFNDDPLQSSYSGSYTVDPATLVLPNLHGYGSVPDLYIGMSQDPTLLGMVQDLNAETLSDASDFDSQIEDILYRWAGVGSVSQGTIDPHVDARAFNFLETYLSNTAGVSSETYAIFFQGIFDDLFTTLKAQLLVQGPLSSLFAGVSYDYASDALVGTADLSSIASTLSSTAPTTANDAAAYWASLVPVLDEVAKELNISQSTYDSVLETAFSSAGLPSSLEAIHGIHLANSYVDGSGNNVFTLTGASEWDGINLATAAPGAVVNGSGSNNVLVSLDANLTSSVISNVQTLEVDDGGEVFSGPSPGTLLTPDQLAGFTTIDTAAPERRVLASDTGTYSFAGKTVGSGIILSARSTSNNVTLVANNSGNTLENGAGADTLTGGTGNDTFDIIDSSAGTTITGGGGTDTLYEESGDISQMNVSGIDIIKEQNQSLKLDNSEFTSVQTFINYGNLILYAMDGGIADLSGKTITGGGSTYLNASNTSANVTLIGTNENGQIITGGGGVDTIESGNGVADQLVAGSGNTSITGGTGGDHISDGAGVDTLLGGSGNDTFYISYGSSGTSVTGGGGSDTLYTDTGDISHISITNVQTLYTGGVELTSAQFNEFTTLSGYGTLYAADGGTYDLSSKTISGSFYGLSAADTSANVTLIGDNESGQSLTGGSGTDILEAGSGSSDYLYAGSGATTLVAGSGGDQLFDGASVDTMEGGSGNDNFHVSTAASGTTITGGGGNDTLTANAADISNMSVSGVQTLMMFGTKLNNAEFSQFSTISGYGNLYAADAGTYDLSSKTITASIYDLSARETSANVTLIGDSDSYQEIDGGSGSDTIQAGNGTGVYLEAGSGTTTMVGGSGGDTFYDGAGVDTIEGGSGNDTIWVSNATSGSTITGGGGSDILKVETSDISHISVSGVQTLWSGGTELSNAEFTGFSALQLGGTLYAADAGTYDLSSKTIQSGSSWSLSAIDTSANVTLIGDNEDYQTLTGGTGSDTLQAGNGTGDWLYAGSGNSTLIAGTGTDNLSGGHGTNVYDFGSTFGHDTIYNAGNTVSETAAGTVAFTSGVSDENLWFQQSGQDLQIDRLGTSEQVTINGWFNANGDQVSSITAGGNTLDTQISSLVSAMASYAANNNGFDPTSATAMPTDTTLQNAITSAWHA